MARGRLRRGRMARGRLRRGTLGGPYQVGECMSDLRWSLNNQAGSLLSLSRLLWQVGAQFGP